MDKTTKDPRSNDERVQELLEMAGHRPGVPQEDLKTIKAAARQAWREKVGTEGVPQSGRRLVWLVAAAAVVVAALGAVWWMRSGLIAPEPHAEGVDVALVEIARGFATVLPEGSRDLRPLSQGAQLRALSIVETGGMQEDAPGRLALRLASGPSLRLDESTRIVLLSSSSIRLEKGAVYVDTGPASEDHASVEILTSFGTVRDMGTQFEVRLDPGSGGPSSLRVRVREGEVLVQTGGDAHTAPSGSLLSLLENGTVSRETSPTYGSHWDWVLAASPLFQIEGRTLQEFLLWVGRETGWRVEFANLAVETEASWVILHGSVQGLTPDRAPAVILEGCGFEHRLEDGTLVVGP